MPDKLWMADAPANIALIKYMGKTATDGNIPSNASLSYTLDYLVTRVELESWDRPYDKWEPLSAPGFSSLYLSEQGQQRFLKHLADIKDIFLYEGHFVVRSCNNFPSDAGVASSASSFAALTQVATKALTDLTYSSQKRPHLSAGELARISRRGSGSSCRSFYPGWVEWKGESVEPVPLHEAQNLVHILSIVDGEKKSVSSSQAHSKVTTSLLMEGRTQRAENRLLNFKSALKSQQWRNAFEIAWAEFWDMHALFATSQPPFGYMKPGSLQALQVGLKMWDETGNGPLMTMDAGANVHFLMQARDRQMAFDLLRDLAEYGVTLTNLDFQTTSRHGLI